MTPSYKINELVCSYGAGLPEVLKIQSLTIHRGELIFLLGASGSGKSTLLETLGLMNNTIRSGEVIYCSDEPKEYPYSTTWNDAETLSKLRKEYFNFIFQNTNLMENFTAYENVCLAGMIKEGKKQDEILNEVKKLMERVGLPESEVGITTLAKNLSGGQRQRLAFVRALCSGSQVLLCDEPTGNLDEANANELFEVIRENLQEKVTAVVVSHDIDLALKYADRIVLLTKNRQQGYGEVLAENILERKSWENLSFEKRDELKHSIRSTFVTREHLIAESTDLTSISSKAGKRFTSLFIRRESAALSGKKSSNFILLTTIFLFSLIAIGFGNGSLDYLNEKLSSAFVKWLSVSIPNSRAKPETLEPLLNELNNSEVRNHYRYEPPSTFTISGMYVYNPTKKDSSFPKGRTFDFNKDRQFLSEEIFGTRNRIYGKPFQSEKELSLIVTPEFLKNNGYTIDSGFIELCFQITSRDSVTHYRHVPIPIRAVVKELPGKDVTYGCLNYCEKAYLTNFDSPFNLAKQTDALYYFIEESDSLAANSIVEIIKKHGDDNSLYGRFGFNNIDGPAIDSSSMHPGFQIVVSLWNAAPSYRTLDSISVQLWSLPEMKPFLGKARRIINYHYVDDAKLADLNPTTLSFYITDLDSVRTFREFIKRTINDEEQIKAGNIIDVDLTQIQNKENYNYLSTVTRIISYLVIVFGSVAVSLFIFNLLRMHLTKVKMNIGTFMAIGLDNKKTRKTYFTIIMLFIFCSILMSFGVASLIGYGVNLVVMKYFNLEDTNYFSLMNWNTLFAIVVFISSSLLVSWFTINRILSKSPGDLIYNR